MNRRINPQGAAFALVVLALFAGIALVVWADSQQPDAEIECIKSGGAWTRDKDDVYGNVYFVCKLEEKQ